MGKPTICICENKDADQLRGNREADQRLCFRYSDSIIPVLLKYPKFQASSSLLCLYRPVYIGPVQKPNCWFSHEAAHLFPKVQVNTEEVVALSRHDWKIVDKDIKPQNVLYQFVFGHRT